MLLRSHRDAGFFGSVILFDANDGIDDKNRCPFLRITVFCETEGSMEEFFAEFFSGRTGEGNDLTFRWNTPPVSARVSLAVDVVRLM